MHRLKMHRSCSRQITKKQIRVCFFMPHMLVNLEWKRWWFVRLTLTLSSLLSDLWISFGTGNDHRLLPIHLIFHDFRRRDGKFCFLLELSVQPTNSRVLPSYREICHVVIRPNKHVVNCKRVSKIIVCYQRKITRCHLPTGDALLQHTKRAIFQASYWRKCLVAKQNLLDPTEYGWKQEENGQFSIQWITKPEASAICRELIYCGCHPAKGCKGRRKCKKASLKCTALCKCGGDCMNEIDL